MLRDLAQLERLYDRELACREIAIEKERERIGRKRQPEVAGFVSDRYEKLRTMATLPPHEAHKLYTNAMDLFEFLRESHAKGSFTQLAQRAFQESALDLFVDPLHEESHGAHDKFIERDLVRGGPVEEPHDVRPPIATALDPERITRATLPLPPTFDGTKLDRHSLGDWLQSVRDFTCGQSGKEEAQVALAARYLIGSAQRFYKLATQANPPTTWKQFSSVLRRHYYLDDVEWECVSELARGYQRQGESAEDFYLRMGKEFKGAMESADPFLHALHTPEAQHRF